jgi:hypothetical protein
LFTRISVHNSFQLSGHHHGSCSTRTMVLFELPKLYPHLVVPRRATNKKKTVRQYQRERRERREQRIAAAERLAAIGDTGHPVPPLATGNVSPVHIAPLPMSRDALPVHTASSPFLVHRAPHPFLGQTQVPLPPGVASPVPFPMAHPVPPWRSQSCTLPPGSPSSPLA